jgi:hypothetical protein
VGFNVDVGFGVAFLLGLGLTEGVGDDVGEPTADGDRLTTGTAAVAGRTLGFPQAANAATASNTSTHRACLNDTTGPLPLKRNRL